MITPEDVKYQLLGTLPRYTDEYFDIVTPSAVVVDSGVIKITSASHGLSTGDFIVGSSVKVKIPATSTYYSTNDGNAIIKFEFEHDRSAGDREFGGYNIATLEGFDDSAFNGDFTILKADRTDIAIKADAAPTGTLGRMIEERNLYFGYQEVTKVDDDTFTIPLQDTIPDGTEFDVFSYAKEGRIVISADETRSVTEFARHRDEKPTLYIVFTEETASRDRNTINDTVLSATAQNPMHLTYILVVELLSIAITKSEHLAAEKQQEIYQYIKPAIRKAMYGYTPESAETAIVFAAVEESNTPVRYNSGYYLHRFVYQLPYKISIEQGTFTRPNVSLRHLVVNSKIFDTEGDTITADLFPGKWGSGHLYGYYGAGLYGSARYGY